MHNMKRKTPAADAPFHLNQLEFASYTCNDIIFIPFIMHNFKFKIFYSINYLKVILDHGGGGGRYYNIT